MFSYIFILIIQLSLLKVVNIYLYHLFENSLLTILAQLLGGGVPRPLVPPKYAPGYTEFTYWF